MEFFINDPNIKRFPPGDTRLINLHAEPYPDGKRLHVSLELTPFLQRPYLEIMLKDIDENVVASTSIIEPNAWKLELTLHLREPQQSTQNSHENESTTLYTLSVSLSYPDIGEIDRRSLSLELSDTDS